MAALLAVTLVPLAVVLLLVWAFGWTGGRQLVRQSYDDAKTKAAEQTEARKARKAAGASDPASAIRRTSAPGLCPTGSRNGT